VFEQRYDTGTVEVGSRRDLGVRNAEGVDTLAERLTDGGGRGGCIDRVQFDEQFSGPGGGRRPSTVRVFEEPVRSYAGRRRNVVSSSDRFEPAPVRRPRCGQRGRGCEVRPDVVDSFEYSLRRLDSLRGGVQNGFDVVQIRVSSRRARIERLGQEFGRREVESSAETTYL